MRKLDNNRGLWFVLVFLASAIGVYGTLWLLLAIGIMLGY